MEDMNRMDRREAIKWMLAASASLSVLGPGRLGAAARSGYGTDPNLMQVYKPGDLWALTFTKEQHQTVSALCDVIVPADAKSPGASQVKVPDFLDEWISAPYPKQQADRKQLLEGLSWLEAESDRRFQQPFAALGDAQKQQICDDICSTAKATSAHIQAAHFFDKFRELTLGAFYSTPEGMKDVQYLGNIPLTKFDGPPQEVLTYLKLT